MKQSIQIAVISALTTVVMGGVILTVATVFAAPTQAPPSGNPTFPLQGPTGTQGIQGLPGIAGAQGASSGSVIAIHSQSTSTPACPSGWTSLWTGYSLIGTFMAEGFGQTNDLGKSGSCVPTNIERSPFLECSNPTNCARNTPGDYSMWLGTGVDSAGTLTTPANSSLLSRCNVCEKPAQVLTRHSFTTSVPSCPAGWTQLWTGYSSAAMSLTANMTHGSDLASPGSCLQQFHRIPFTECWGDVECDGYTGGDYASWIEATSAGNPSRCSVCSK